MGTSTAELDAWLAQFDGQSRNALLARVESRPADARLLEHLVTIAEVGDERRQIAALALLKAYQRQGVSVPVELSNRLLDLLPGLISWKARLLVLQMLPSLSIPATQADSLCDCLQSFLSLRNKFIRAWSYSGLHRLAVLYPEYRAAVAPLLDVAGRKEAASVRARLRQLPPLTK